MTDQPVRRVGKVRPDKVSWISAMMAGMDIGCLGGWGLGDDSRRVMKEWRRAMFALSDVTITTITTSHHISSHLSLSLSVAGSMEPWVFGFCYWWWSTVWCVWFASCSSTLKLLRGTWAVLSELCSELTTGWRHVRMQNTRHVVIHMQRDSKERRSFEGFGVWGLISLVTANHMAALTPFSTCR